LLAKTNGLIISQDIFTIKMPTHAKHTNYFYNWLFSNCKTFKSRNLSVEIGRFSASKSFKKVKIIEAETWKTFSFIYWSFFFNLKYFVRDELGRLLLTTAITQASGLGIHSYLKVIQVEIGCNQIESGFFCGLFILRFCALFLTEKVCVGVLNLCE